MNLSIITPVWNQAHLTAQFLNHHQRYYANRDDIEIIIIDNGSSDSTPTLLKHSDSKSIKSSDLKIIANDTNCGFATASNQGAVEASGDHLLFLNNDILLHGDYVSILLDHRFENKLLGASYLNFNTGWNKFDGKLISYLAGWCLMVKTEDFFNLGKFDERYYPGDYEDMDFCLNAVNNGFELQEVDLPITHISGQTAEKMLDRNRVTLENQKRFMEKWGFKNVG